MVAEAIAFRLDRGREQILRVFLKSDFARQIFFSRANRLFFLFSIACLVNLTLALFFPLWVLAIGPLVYGFPHLIASLRYGSFHLGLRSPGFLGNLLLSYIALSLLLTLFPEAFAVQLLGLSIEWWVLALLVVLSLALPQRKLSQRLRPVLLLAPVFALASAYPLETAGAMILAHNLIAFVFWIRSARPGSEKWSAITATAIFLALITALLFGAFDPLYRLFSPSGELKWAGLNYWDTGTLIFGKKLQATLGLDYKALFHATVVYAFGQAMHYFVWMKAIPDEFHSREVPTTFRSSLALLRADYRGYVFVLAALVLGGALVWLLGNHTWARGIYFAMAALHGYFEIAALAAGKLATR